MRRYYAEIRYTVKNKKYILFYISLLIDFFSIEGIEDIFVILRTWNKGNGSKNCQLYLNDTFEWKIPCLLK